MADRLQIREEFLQPFMLVHFSASHSWYSYIYTLKMCQLVYVYVSCLITEAKKGSEGLVGNVMT